MMLRRLSSPEAKLALRSFDAAAERLDPFDFHPADEAFSRMATLGPFYLRRAEWQAMSAAARCRSVVLSNLTTDGEVYCGNGWEVSVCDYPFDNLKQDKRWNGIGSSAIADPGGAWTIVVSNEGHGVVSGSREFVTAFLNQIPSGGENLAELIDRLFVGKREKAEADARLLGMVVRLYGREAADQAIQESGIDSSAVTFPR